MEDPLISVIIPSWGEDFYKAVELALQEEALDGFDVEWVLAVATPPADWREHWESHACPNVHLVECSTTGRGLQMNEGAEVARGEWLVFNHADTQLSATHLRALAEKVVSTDFNAGAFHRVLDSSHHRLMPFDPVVRWVNEKFGILFGDQSVFIRRETFQELDGFKPYKLMEDVEFSRRVRRKERVVILDPPILTSDRRAVKLGSWRVKMINLGLLSLFYLGASPETLHKIYYRSWNK